MARSTSFSNASEKYSYVYDEANQLIRENLYYGTGNSNNATITYQYDSWGNLLYKRTYAYTTGTLGTVQETVTYTYGNSSWKDQLTSYNGQSITYDASGNPTSYLGAALVWEGQRLKSYTPASTGSGRVNAYTYNYDENGIRTQKTINGVTTSYYYNGSLLMSMTVGAGSTAKVMLFSYDAGGNVIAVDYSENNGSSFSTYYYLRNAQNDVVKLIDGSGNAVIQYTYDSWGKLLSTTGSLAETFGTEQPFRYRGYVYDEETGFYYLQSRYYNPEVGCFISADVYLSTGQGVIGHNAYAYCGNNPIIRLDSTGNFWDTIFDIVSLCLSVAEVIANPTDPWAWAGLAGDVIDLVPFVTGIGEVTRIVKTTAKAVDKADDVIDAAKAIYKAADATSDLRKSTGVYEILFESGKNYVGKGGFKRAIKSATDHIKIGDAIDDVVSIAWAPAKNAKQAFVLEFFLQVERRVNNASTYNKIWSPGKRIFMEWIK